MQFKLFKDTFRLRTILLVLDFAKNYTVQLQNDIHSQYYHSKKVGIKVHITYRHGPNSTKENKVILKESHFYISDSKNHDFYYLQHYFYLFYEWLIDGGIPFHQHCIWLDGCEGQFKISHVFQSLALLHIKFNVSHLWSYFKIGHGKGEHDGTVACIKITPRRG